MGSVLRIFYLFVSLGMFSACTPSVNDSSGCHILSYYNDQTECLKDVAPAACEMTTVNSSQTSMVCWRKKASNSGGGTSGGTTGATTGGTTGSNALSCSGVSTPWNLGAWTPSVCAPSVTQLTRTVTCNYTCPCNSPSPKPSETYKCTPDLYNAYHYESECTASGGSIIWLGTARVCNFSGGSCPSGWSGLFSGTTPYTITVPASAEEHTNWHGGRQTVTTGSHSTFMAYQEQLIYCSSRNITGCRTWSTLYSTVSRVACY